MSVHYKFKSSLDFDTITFDGLHISVADLKKAIIHQKRLGKIIDFDLQITNAQTKEEYGDDTCLIPKNTSLVIARIPLSHQNKKQWDTQLEKVAPVHNATKIDGASVDLVKMKVSEEEKIQAMMLQSTIDYNPKSYQRVRGQSQVGEVPVTYRCNKCKKGGHWIKNCPYIVGKDVMDIKRNTGIPKSFRDKVPDTTNKEIAPVSEVHQQIPEELLCSICHNLFTDAVMIPCCGSSFCDDCVRTALLESEDNECPDCKEKGSSPGSLIPNRFLRNSVNTFKNETGYKVIPVIKDSQDTANTPVDEVALVSTSTVVPKAPSKNGTSVATTEKDTEKSLDKPNTTGGIPKEIVQNHPESKSDSANIDEVESDFEDNITITMPQKTAEGQGITIRDRLSSIRNSNTSRHPKPPGIENSPYLQVSPLNAPVSENICKSPFMNVQNSEWDPDFERENDFRDHKGAINKIYEYNGPPMKHQEMPVQLSNMPPQFRTYQMPDQRPVRMINPRDNFPVSLPRMNPYQLVPPHHQPPHCNPIPAPPMNSYNNMYNQIPPRMGLGYPPFIRPIYHNVRPDYMPPRERQGNTNETIGLSNLASVYQGVSAKVGTGIIDDPLEAFNRIMKEKEKRKKERRKSLDHHHRSRSPEKQQQIHFRSTTNERRKGRDTRSRDDREYNRDGIHERQKNIRYRRSNSFSDRSSRSRSRSHSPAVKNSRSPIYKRHSSSRMQTFRDRFRERGKDDPYNKQCENSLTCPMQSSKRNKSPIETRGRKWYQSDMPASVFSKNEDYYKRSSYGRSRSPQMKRFHGSSPVKLNKCLETTSHEALEPPPPGYEGIISKDNIPCNAISKLNENNMRRSKTPELYDNYSEGQKVYDIRPLYEGSESSNNKITEKKRKHPRSVTPITSSSKVKENKQNKERQQEKNMKIDRTSEKDKNYKDERYREDKSSQVIETSDHKKSENHDENSSKKMNMQIKKEQKQNVIDSKLDKRTKERKKRRKERSDRKKVKKDRKDKRIHDKNETTEVNPENKNLCNNNLNKSENINIDTHDAENSKHVTMNADTQHDEQRKEKLDIFKLSVIKKPVQVNCLSKENNSDNVSGTHKTKMQIPPDNVHSKATNSPSEFKRFDSVLDIHGYDTDFEEMNMQDPKNKITVPEPSKWEREEHIITEMSSNNIKDEYNDKGLNDCNEKVTNEVLRKAENAIFARAINAIRPLQLKKSIIDNQELCSMESSPGIENRSISDIADKAGVSSFQITVPTNCNQERSVEIKGECVKKPSSPKAIKSVKERLGSKIISKSEHSPERNLDERFNININRQFEFEFPNYEHKKERESIIKRGNSFRNRNRSYERKVVNRNFESKGNEMKSNIRNRSRERHRNYNDERNKTNIRRRNQLSQLSTNAASYRRDNKRYKNFENDHIPAEKHENQRIERSEKSERSERSERFEKVERPERSERSERHNRSERPERSERSERIEKSERCERHERSEKPERHDRSEKKDLKEDKYIIKGDKSNQNELSNKSHDNQKDVKLKPDATANISISDISKGPLNIAEKRSSACFTSDSDLESVNSKHRKKHKGKKEKKRIKHSSSSRESVMTEKRKHMKTKKKSKSTRSKKKKSKK